MELNCDFGTKQFKNRISPYEWYICWITSAAITKPDTKIKTVHGKHSDGNTNDDVQSIGFRDTVVNFIPKGLTEIFPNLICLHINKCGLKEICREDLVGFENLEYLEIEYNKLTSLPDDLFLNTPKLKWISFTGNKIESMSSNLFKPIINNEFERIKFLSNSKINALYNPGHSKSVSSVAELMRIIDAKCSKPKIIETSHSENFIKNSENLFMTGHFSDFVIIVNNQKEFKVHKNILAQSKGFAELFQNDPTATEMKIEDLSPKAVEEFLRYLYTGKLPKNNENSMDIFALASTLKVPELKNEMQKLILYQLDNENAWKIFSLAHKYESNELKIAGFKEIQKMFPDRYLPEKIADNFSMVQEIMDMKVKMDAIFGKASKFNVSSCFHCVFFKIFCWFLVFFLCQMAFKYILQCFALLTLESL